MMWAWLLATNVLSYNIFNEIGGEVGEMAESVSSIASMAAGIQERSLLNECGHPFDIVFLLESTEKWNWTLPILSIVLPYEVDRVSRLFPNSQYALAEYRDKPYDPVGAGSDFCYRLRSGGLTSNTTDFKNRFNGITAAGGGDIAQDSFQAQIHAMLDPAVKWRTVINLTERTTRVLVVFVSAVPHIAGDLQKYDRKEYPSLPQYLPPNSGTISVGNPSFECLYLDYPIPIQLLLAASITGTQIIYMVVSNDTAVIDAWKWVNVQLLKQPSSYLYVLDEYLMNMPPALEQAARAVDDKRCSSSSLWPPEPSTTKLAVESSTGTNVVLETTGTNVAVEGHKSTTKVAGEGNTSTTKVAGEGNTSTAKVAGEGHGSSTKVAVEGYPPTTTTKVAVEGYPPTTTTKVAVEGYPPTTTTKVAVEGYPPTTTTKLEVEKPSTTKIAVHGSTTGIVIQPKPTKSTP